VPRKEASSLARARPGGAALPVTHETVEELTIVTYDGIRMHVRAVGEERLRELAARDGRVGEIYAGLERLRNRYEEEIRRRFPKLKARPPGVNLDDLLPENGFHLAKALVDSGDTCVEIVEATVRVTQLPEQAALVTFKARDAVETAKLVTRANRHEPAKVRALDGMLLVEFRGETENEARERAAALVEELRRDAGTPPASVAFDGEHRNRVWLSYVSAVTGLGLVDAAIVPP
jgi:FAD/FMN-containing dehydrogenase